MGVELELENYKYEGKIYLGAVDHIRLFESEKKRANSPLWYLEVDGSGALEFVSQDFLTTEAAMFSQCISEMNILMEDIVNKVSIDSSQLAAPQINTWQLLYFKGDKIKGIGKFVHKSPHGDSIIGSIPIKIERTPFPYVLPQATFQFPLSHMSNFVEYMAVSHERLKNAFDATKIYENNHQG